MCAVVPGQVVPVQEAKPFQDAALTQAANPALEMATAQHASEILRRTAETYRRLHSLELAGVLRTHTTVSGVPYEVTWPLELAQADSTAVPSDSPVPALSPLIRFGFQQIRRSDDRREGPGGPGQAELSPPKGWAQFDRIDRHVHEIRAFSAETIAFGGVPKACWLVEVAYEPGFPGRALSGQAVRYWIDQSSYLVLRERFGRREGTADEVTDWVFEARSVKLDQPPPDWAVEAMGDLAGHERHDWAARVAPDFTLEALDGREVRLAGLRGKAVLLSFWASWCTPCKEEMPLIEDLAAEYASRGLVVWGVTNESAEKALEWLGRFERSLPTLVDDHREVFRDYEAEKIPVSVVLDRGGRVVSYRVGLSGKQQLRAAIVKALGPETP